MGKRPYSKFRCREELQRDRHHGDPKRDHPASVFTIGSGPDILVLNMSEDPYLGDAQTTVAVDSMQLAPSFTTSVSHASGSSQRFTIMGDWGVGPHSVTVKFLNDAHGGTPATDRNLYVNGISYDGATGLGAELKDGSPKSFSVTDTTPVTGATILHRHHRRWSRSIRAQHVGGCL